MTIDWINYPGDHAPANDHICSATDNRVGDNVVGIGIVTWTADDGTGAHYITRYDGTTGQYQSGGKPWSISRPAFNQPTGHTAYIEFADEVVRVHIETCPYDPTDITRPCWPVEGLDLEDHDRGYVQVKSLPREVPGCDLVKTSPAAPYEVDDWTSGPIVAGCYHDDDGDIRLALGSAAGVGVSSGTLPGGGGTYYKVDTFTSLSDLKPLPQSPAAPVPEPEPVAATGETRSALLDFFDRA